MSNEDRPPELMQAEAIRIVGRLGLLYRNLESARSAFDEDKVRGISDTIGFIHRYLTDSGFDPKLTHPLIELQTGLSDILEGRNSDLLKRRKRPDGGAPRGSRQGLQHDINMACAAAIVSLYMDAGETEDDALRRVSRAVPNLRSAQLARWRDHRHEMPEDVVAVYDGLYRRKRDGLEKARSMGTPVSAEHIARLLADHNLAVLKAKLQKTA